MQIHAIISGFLPCVLLVHLIGTAFADKSPEFIDRFYQCNLCRCYTEYQDRDISLPLEPIEETRLGYGLNLDECLYSCQINDDCAAVVWGYIGGRKAVTCELYSEVRLPYGVQYTYGINTYIKSPSMDCPLEQIDAVAEYAEDSIVDAFTTELDGQARWRKQAWGRVNRRRFLGRRALRR